VYLGIGGISVADSGEVCIEQTMINRASQASFGIVNEGDIGCVNCRYTDVNADVSSVLPFAVRGSISKGWVEHIGWTAEYLVVLGTKRIISHRE
jgi:hypothetical protein